MLSLRIYIYIYIYIYTRILNITNASETFLFARIQATCQCTSDSYNHHFRPYNRYHFTCWSQLRPDNCRAPYSSSHIKSTRNDALQSERHTFHAKQMTTALHECIHRDILRRSEHIERTVPSLGGIHGVKPRYDDGLSQLYICENPTLCMHL